VKNVFNVIFKFFRRNSYVSISKLEISSDPKLLTFNSTLYQAANQSQFDIYLNFLVDIEVMYLEVRIRHYSKGSYVPSFLNLNVNYCDFLKMKQSVPILEQIYDHLRKHGKFADRCPLKKVRGTRKRISQKFRNLINYRMSTLGIKWKFRYSYFPQSCQPINFALMCYRGLILLRIREHWQTYRLFSISRNF
jgi:Protein of unknown function (DUF1091)